MKELVSKFISIEDEISKDKGDFILFALFLREDAETGWDLLVSAPWIQANKKEALNYLANRVQSSFTQTELLNLSRIAILETDNPALENFHKSINVEHGSVEVVNSNFFGLQIKV